MKHNLVEIARASSIRFQPTEFINHKALRVELYGVVRHPGNSLAFNIKFGLV